MSLSLSPTPPPVNAHRPCAGASLHLRRRPHFVAMAGAASREDGAALNSGVKSVAVVGAGVSGLTAAYRLRSRGVEVTVFEAEERAGGKIQTGSDSGLVWDQGANTMTESEDAVSRLIDDLGLREKQQYPLSQHKRYIVKDGEPLLIPASPIALIKSSILSARAKLGLLMEPFLWKHPGSTSSGKVSDESTNERSLPSCAVYPMSLMSIVGRFFERHFGTEVVDYLIDPFLAGTNAGDPESLCMRYAMPDLWNLEKKYGSIIVGAILSKLTSKGNTAKPSHSSMRKRSKRESFSFSGGMQTLVDTLCAEIGSNNLKLCSKVLSLSCDYDGSASRLWSVSFSSNDDKNMERTENQSFDAVIMTAPVGNVQKMKFTKSGFPYVLNFLPKVRYLPLSMIVTSYKREDVKRPLEGFGVLVPHMEQKHGLRTIGTLFSSMMFPDRAPNDQYLYTTFVGGSLNKELAEAPPDMLKEIVTSDLRKLLGADGQPTFIKHIYWKNAFPLYDSNYGSVLCAIEKMEATLPGFFYAGNHKDGLSVGKVIASGSRAADLVISYLGSERKLNS